MAHLQHTMHFTGCDLLQTLTAIGPHWVFERRDGLRALQPYKVQITCEGGDGEAWGD